MSWKSANKNYPKAWRVPMTWMKVFCVINRRTCKFFVLLLRSSKMFASFITTVDARGIF
jgi:hypothetical protein